MYVYLYYSLKDTKLIRLLLLLVMLSGLWPVATVRAQIVIGGNVYGGGNAGDMTGNTSVTVYAGDVKDVYGGARMADVGGRTFVNIDGEHASDDILIMNVYGGNDIAGTIGTNGAAKKLPSGLTHGSDNGINETWDGDAIVRTTANKATAQATVEGASVTADKYLIIIGSLFGGGNGDYTYGQESTTTGEGNEAVTTYGDYFAKKDGVVVATSSTEKLEAPELPQVYLEVMGGNIAHVYGGGNNATVTKATTICIDNQSDHLEKVATVRVAPNVSNDKTLKQALAELLVKLQEKVDLSSIQNQLTSYAFNHARVYGGNNKADMAIIPKWDLRKGIIRDLYSGGNSGRMISSTGILLEIAATSNIVVNNVYGGCRKADVRPMAINPTTKEYADVDHVSNPGGYNFPPDLAARLLIRGGDINNVYGGNDISGKVYFGNAVGVYTSIRGDIYGGGNGSYAYTDNPDLKGHIIWGDYYYDPGSSSVEALNAFRPNAEQVSIRVAGTDADHPTIIGGGIYVGGNSATLVRKAGTQAQKVELKIGSYVIADKVFLGNNGENMVKSNEKDDVNGISEGVLRTMASTSITSNSTKFNSIDLTDPDVFAKYMEGCAMDLRPQVVFDNEQNGDPDTYQHFTSYFGSFFCGGNVGSMTYPGTNTLNFNKPVYIYNKVVGGCNNAFVASSGYNAVYKGGITEALTDDEKATNANKLVLNFNGTLMKPMRLKSDGTLEWNTKKWQTSENAPAKLVDAKYGDEGVNAADLRLDGGNVYGGCYTSGYVNGNVEINILSDLVEKDKVFGTAEGNSGVDRVQQYSDVLGTALNVFGAGYGEQSEIRGSTTINITDGYAFQTFGGGEKGEVKGNCTTNLKGGQVEYIYGGGMEGNVKGSVYTHLGDGQCVGVIGGACNANIGGHTEVYIGDLGFPTVTEDVYGGNDFGGKIEGTSEELGNHIRDEVKNMVTGNYGAASYVEYRQGSVRNIFGGCYGSYNYEDKTYKEHIKNTQKSYLRNAFVNFRPDDKKNGKVAKIFGAGEGYPGDRDGDKSQDFSYVLIDIPENDETFKTTEVFGAGAYDGLGMRYTAAETFQKAEAATETTPAKEAFDPIEASAVIDLMRGRISAAYGGSLDEGVTRRTLVNVPSGSTIKINNIFGGAYGNHILPPCDVYEANVNYRSGNARVNGGIYGGNNHVRRTIYATVNISVPVLKENGYNGIVYGAGKGLETWAEYTEVNLESGANVYEAYGGSEMGNVLNAESVEAYMKAYAPKPADKLLTEDETEWKNADRWTGVVGKSELKSEYQTEWQKVWKTAWTIGDYYIPSDDYSNYVDNQYTNLTNAAFVRTAEMDDRDYTGYSAEEKTKRQYRYNTNVIINEGATVGGYVYGGGLGDSKTALSGGIYGSTYVAVLGGTVAKDVYAAGTSGSVSDVFEVGAYNSENNTKGFTASANVYVKGGTVRNVYGGGWEGHVGHHEGAISASTSDDQVGETHVVVGVRGDNNFLTGAPAVTRNVYGGGEGGSVYGKAHVTVNNGHIGYRYVNGEYKEELDDKEPGDNDLDQGGNVFGGGYVVNSYTDASDITMWGGQVRGCLYGGGELGPIGRGSTLETASTDNAFINGPAKIYKGGEAHVTLYGGHVMRNVFGGGRGFDNWNGDGTMFMSKEVRESLDLSSKGYVFGSTDVRIRGGEVGTHADVAQGLEVGNVFGGGNQGFVYSATGTKHGVRKTQALSEMTNGLPTDGGGYYYSKWIGDEGVGTDHSKCELSLDCNVVVEPYCRVTDEGGISGFTASADGTVKSSYAKGEYVPLEALNQLKSKTTDAARWSKIDYTTGVTIHNAVFAGGNVTVGSDQMYVNTGTVFGNVTAALRDVYHRDLITIGTEHTGGIYGDGNLTMVDGWREIHIDNYGTDYYTMEAEISKSDYEAMSDRERAYFVLNYKTRQEITGTKSGTLAANKRMTLDEIKEAFDFDNYKNSDYPEDYKKYISADGTPNPTYFTEMGFCSIYAGRLLNTIQRCDMAAVWGSRIVLQGARDRVPEKADYTRYTLNRVGELSLNQRISEAGDPQKITVGSTQVDNPEYKHGNYFGIYSVVNYLGNLTSDVFFTQEDVSQYDSEYSSIRTTDNANSNNAADGHTTYYDWKVAHAGKANRNNATSPNKVCLASGVYLELIREESEKSDKREWGLITGVVELDLIDVKTGLGGGYVYARNQHGVKTWHRDWSKVNLSPYNEKARTYKRFTYNETESTLNEIETSGNFVHNTKQIIDDCYPNANAYKASQSPYSEAHYWYIKGLIYVYDQYISAYTGSANAYAETVNIPLTIAAASHGRMTLRDVQPNLYAYYDDNGDPLGTDGTVIVGDITYRAGDPIDYWTYSTLSDKDQNHFVKNVYTTIAECTIGNDTYPEGSILLPSDIETLRASAPQTEIDGKYVRSVYHVEQQKDVPFDYVFRVANKIGHDAGFVLTYDVNNPSVWNNYYTQTTSPSTHKNTEEYAALTDKGKAAYTEGPTYQAVTPGVYGQRNYEKGEIISKGVYDAYQSIGADRISQLADQATAEPAYVITSEWTGKNASGTDQHLYEGTPVFKSDYTDEVWAAMPKSEATLCTSTLQLSETEYVYAGDLLSTDKLAALKTRLKTENSGWTDADVTTYLNNYLSNAYYITQDGAYGGRYYETGKAYLALDAWCSLSESDRDNFRYNYDALDLLIDPDFKGGYGFKPQYDGYVPGTTQSQINGNNATEHYEGCTPLNPNLYSKTQPIDYEAEFSPTAAQIQELGTYYDETTHKLKYKDENKVSVEISTGYDARIKSTRFEDIPNERAHWSPIIVTDPGTYYVVKEAFINGDLPYTVGQQIDATVYNSLTESNKGKIRLVNITEGYAHKNTETGKYDQLYYYYCRESYKIGEKGEGTGFHAETNNKDYTDGETVDADIIIKSEEYDKLVNLQKGFIIHGSAPEETTTLYVSRETDIFDLQKEKIITVIYMYEYQESDESGNNITPVSERHIVNIHINFESGAPEIGPLTPPGVVLPGTTVGLKLPRVEPGAFEISSSGWEIFDNKDNATLHVNGQPYQNNTTPMYWYQNGYWVAYYAQTYLGKTYSEPVQFTVANYHDLKKVMDDKEHHYYIDHKDVDREPKIYINDYSQDETGDKNGLDLFRDLIDLTHHVATYDDDHHPKAISGGRLNGHIPLERTSTTETEKPMRGGKYLDIIMHSNQDHAGSAWTPIADNEGECFSGTLHGDGYYISGLNNSLFNHLCGDVYNLGVMGTFTGAGIAETGEGYVENCWISTSSTEAKTSMPIFGSPTITSGDESRPIRIVNSYYLEDDDAANKYTNHSGTNGTPTRMSAQNFYNGTVAYDLNGFYLYKRYSDKMVTSGTDDNKYDYYTIGTDGKLNKTTGYYGDYDNPRAKLCSAPYVEDRYADGDFRYADGEIPETEDERAYTDENGEKHFYPIWPDDYIFFGQALTYGYDETRAHQDVPSHINRFDNRVLTDATGNRVLRAPAYFRSYEMDVVHFNPYAVFVKSKKDVPAANYEKYKAYENMTAVDLTGYNDRNYDYLEGWNKWSKTSQLRQDRNDAGMLSQKDFFFPPLLDDGVIEGGLSGIHIAGLTQNMLVYTNAPGGTGSNETPTASQKTANVVSTYLPDALYDDHEMNPTYHTVEAWDSYANALHGHWVYKTDDGYTSNRDHFLVDKQDFNAPMAYTFQDGKRMWYQRDPANNEYVDRTKGWSAISLPFSAEIVTTDTKGEITHFYNGSYDIFRGDKPQKDGDNSKVGHEYWLREFTGVKTEGDPSITTANFVYPAEPDDGSDILDSKEVTNTFLWDYYYRGLGHHQEDANSDLYQNYEDDASFKQYYSESRTYESYPMLTHALPYIIGFPGATYYEFDLSGKFAAATTDNVKPVQIGKQTITFASPTGTTINVSDDEIAGVVENISTISGYTFKPSYLNMSFNAGTDNYTLKPDNGSGISSFDKVPSSGDATPVAAFRPYFVKAATQNHTRSIIFSNDRMEELKGVEEHGDPTKEELSGGLHIWSSKGKIFVKSTLRYTVDLRVVTPAGVTVAAFAVKPDHTVEVRADFSGMYVVHTLDGRYIKKLSVRK